MEEKTQGKIGECKKKEQGEGMGGLVIGLVILYKKRSRLNLRKFVFSNRVIDHWNALSDVCV